MTSSVWDEMKENPNNSLSDEQNCRINFWQKCANLWEDLSALEVFMNLLQDFPESCARLMKKLAEENEVTLMLYGYQFSIEFDGRHSYHIH